MPKHTPEQLAAKRRLANRKSAVRTAMIEGNLALAKSIAAKEGFDLQDARLPLIYNNPSEPFFAALEVGEKEAAVEVAAVERKEAEVVREVVLENGWPVQCEAEIWGPCTNTSLVAVTLDDGRRVSLQKTRGLPYRSRDRISIKLIKSRGDPLYVELPRATTTF